MNRRTLSSLAFSLSLVAGGSVSMSSALGQVGTGVTYQGQLKNSGASVNSPADFAFSIWDAAAAGNQIGMTDTKIGVPVSAGLFNTTFDCGVNPYATDAVRWLQISVRNPSNTGGFVPLGSRQRLTAEPFSLATRGLNVDAYGNAGIATSIAGSFFGGTALEVDRPPYAGGTVLLLNNNVNTWDSGTSFNNYRYIKTGSIATDGNWKQFNVAPGGVSIGYSNTPTYGSGDALYANGNVGIGTASPERALHLKGNAPGIFFQDTGDADGPNARWAWDTRAFGVNGIALVRYDGTSANALKSMFLSNSGNLGVGINAFNKVDVQVGSTIGNSTILGSQTNDPSNQGMKVQFGYRPNEVGCGETFCGMRVDVVPGTNFCGNSTDLEFYTAECNSSCPREVMRINGTGNVGMGTTAPGAFDDLRLDVNGNIRCTTLFQTSSREFKQDIVPLTGALASIIKLHGVSYAWNNKAPEQVQGKHDIGFIADEMNDVLPDIVIKDQSGKPVGIDYGKVTPVAVEAIKQQQAQIESMKAENAALRIRLEKIESLLAAHATTVAK